MNRLELVVTERNRLIRYSTITSLVSLVLAVWARDPLLYLTTPFTGTEVGNITVGHIILIGQPVVCILFFLLAAQVLRYKRCVRLLRDPEREHLDWQFPDRRVGQTVVAFGRAGCEFARWFAMAGIPVLVGFVLLFSQFDLQVCEDKASVVCMFNGTSFDVKASYKGWVGEDCAVHIEGSIKRTDCQRRQAILSRMPTLYQPLNFLVGLVLQSFAVILLFGLYRIYFVRGEATTGS